MKSPIGHVGGTAPSPVVLRRRTLALRLAVVSVIAVGFWVSGVFAVSVTFLDNVVFGNAVTTSDQCQNNTGVSFTQSVNSSGTVEVDAISVTGISADCDGEVVAVVIYDSGSTILDEVIWTLALTSGDTGISLAADGSTTDASNSSSGGISTNYPASQADPEGLAQNLISSDISFVEFIHLTETRAARE